MGYRKFRYDEGPKFGPPFLGFVITLTVTGVALLTMAEPQGPLAALRSMPATPAPPVEEAQVVPATPHDDGPMDDVDGFATSAMNDGSEMGTVMDALAPVETTAAKCNVDLCAKAYKSFRASDCTYQPYEGDRRLCRR